MSGIREVTEDKFERAFKRAVDDALQAASELRGAVYWGAPSDEIESLVASFVFAAARVRNRFEELDLYGAP